MSRTCRHHSESVSLGRGYPAQRPGAARRRLVSRTTLSSGRHVAREPAGCSFHRCGRSAVRSSRSLGATSRRATPLVGSQALHRHQNAGWATVRTVTQLAFCAISGSAERCGAPRSSLPERASTERGLRRPLLAQCGGAELVAVGALIAVQMRVTTLPRGSGSVETIGLGLRCLRHRWRARTNTRRMRMP